MKENTTKNSPKSLTELSLPPCSTPCRQPISPYIFYYLG